MAEKTTNRGFEVYTIVSSDGHTRASFIPEKGGIGNSIIMPHKGKEREILFLHDDFWEKTNPERFSGWPFLFPVCARLERMGKPGNYLYGGNIYTMPIHGFAWSLPWKVIDDEKPNQLALELTETKDTLAMYPFQFKVQLTYKVEDGKLICEQIYTNTGDKQMVYYAGFHPYFLTPKPGKGKDKVVLDFQPIRLMRYNDRLTDLIGVGKPFELPVQVTDPKINEQLTEVAESNVVNLQYPDGFNLYMKCRGVPDPCLFRYIQFYTMTDKPFICIEPWMAFPNALNTSIGSRYLSPGGSERGLLELSCIKNIKD